MLNNELSILQVIQLCVFSICLILPAALGPGVYSASDRNEYQKQERVFLGSKVRPVRKIDNLTAICEPTVYRMRNPQHLRGLLRGYNYSTEGQAVFRSSML
jgi:hypothetical protein